MLNIYYFLDSANEGEREPMECSFFHLVPTFGGMFTRCCCCLELFAVNYEFSLDSLFVNFLLSLSSLNPKPLNPYFLRSSIFGNLLSVTVPCLKLAIRGRAITGGVTCFIF